MAVLIIAFLAVLAIAALAPEPMLQIILSLAWVASIFSTLWIMASHV